MIFEHSDVTKHWIDRVEAFMEEHIIPAIPVYQQQDAEG
jgi:acyl-CoA dehydrogenase